MKKTDFKTLSGTDKAAIFLLSIGEEQAARLFSMMEETEIKDISQAMAGLGTIDSDIVEKIFKEFSDALVHRGSLVGTYSVTEKMLNKVLPQDKVSAIMDEIRGPAGRTMWDKLGNVNDQLLANYLKNEYPQTISVVLSKIRSDHAANVLVLLPEALAMEVIVRMLTMEAVQKDVLDGVEKTLKAEFMSNIARTTRRDAHELMADIFNAFDRTTETRFMQSLEERNRESADRIRQLMFTFEDLMRLDAQGIQTLLRVADKEALTKALKGGSEKIQEIFFENMSERAAKMMRDDMEALGPVRLREVDEAQTLMVNTAKDLAASGQIVISEGKEDDELIY